MTVPGLVKKRFFQQQKKDSRGAKRTAFLEQNTRFCLSRGRRPARGGEVVDTFRKQPRPPPGGAGPHVHRPCGAPLGATATCRAHPALPSARGRPQARGPARTLEGRHVWPRPTASPGLVPEAIRLGSQSQRGKRDGDTLFAQIPNNVTFEYACSDESFTVRDRKTDSRLTARLPPDRQG